MVNEKSKAFGIPYWHYIIWLLAFTILYLGSRYNYLLFHSLAELFSIVIAFAIFAIAWNSRRFMTNDYLLFLGITFLFIGGLDTVHTFAYKGMGVFPGYNANLATQLWISARYLESLSLLAAPLFIHRKLRVKSTLSVYALITALLMASIFYWRIFPVCFIDGVGLTPFKVASEYIISFILLCSISLLLKNRKEFSGGIVNLMVTSMVVKIGSEMAFTLYTDVYGVANMIGHFLKIISFYLIYKALIETTFTSPYDLLFHRLKQREEDLTRQALEVTQVNTSLTQEMADRKKTEEEVARASREWSSTFDSIPDLISIHDKNFRVVRANRAFANAVGVDASNCSGRACYELVHGTAEPWRDCPQRKAMEQGRPVTSEFYEPRLGKYLEVSCSPILDENGELTGSVHVARDVTARKRVEETLERAFTESEKQRTEMAAITEALRAVMGKPKFRDAALAIFNTCKSITGATSGYVALLSEDGARNEVLFLDSGGLPCTVDPSLPMPIRGLREKAYSTGKVVYDNTFGNSEWLKFMPQGHMVLDSVLFSPLIIDGKAVGLIGLANKNGGFTEWDARIMAAMGEMTSVGLRNARAADALSNSEKRYRQLIETTTEGVWLAKPTGESIFTNKRMSELLGYTPDEMIGRKREEFIDPEYMELAMKMRAERAAGVSGQYELKLRHKNGSAVWALVSASPLYDEAGNHVANLGMHADITERKKAEEKIADLAKFPEENPNPVMRVARDGAILYANPACQPVLLNWNCHTGGYVPQDIRQLIPEIIESGKDKEIDVEHGSQIYQLTLAHIPGQDYINLYGQNVTVRRRAVEALLKARAELETRVKERTSDLQQKETELRRSNTELQQFAYITSHDMQEPLRMITSYLQLIEKRYKNKLDSDADEFIGFAVDGATRMRNMINDLLEYSRVETRGKQFEPVNLENVLETVLTHLEVAIKENKATVTHDPLPVITADPTQFIQLLQNLIGNAVKFHGSGPPQMHISAKKEGNEWVFSVRDNGIGIEPQYQNRIFNIFQRLHTREEYPGTGIGLAVCKRIVERHGGRIWVESQAGKGATFYFTIPDKVR